MKKFLAFILSFVVVLTAFVPALGFNAVPSSEQFTVCYKTNTNDTAVVPPKTEYFSKESNRAVIADGPSRPGYSFVEWNTLASGDGVSFEPGDILTLQKSVTLYAVWEANENSPVARMYLCATLNSLTGHIWLYFENISEKDINVGYITLAPGSTSSVGNLGNMRANGGGTYYNGEAFMAGYTNGKVNFTVSLKTDISEKQLETVSERIKSMNTYILVGSNCGDFATKVWNSVSPKKVINLLLPVVTAVEMILVGGTIGEFSMRIPNIEECYKQTSDGVFRANVDSFQYSCISFK